MDDRGLVDGFSLDNIFRPLHFSSDDFSSSSLFALVSHLFCVVYQNGSTCLQRFLFRASLVSGFLLAFLSELAETVVYTHCLVGSLYTCCLLFFKVRLLHSAYMHMFQLVSLLINRLALWLRV